MIITLSIATLLYLVPLWFPLCTGVTVQVITQVIRCRKFLPCPCAAPCSELPASGRAVWAAVACTPPEKKATKKWDDEVNPQRDRYVMERLDYFEVVRGRKRGGETESYSLTETRGGRAWPVRERGYERQKKLKVFHSCTETDCLN